MGKRVRELDWSRTPLGPPEEWPPGLRSALSICLHSSFPIAIYWGSDLRVLYNDEWGSILGEKQSWMLGRPACEAWPEGWGILRPTCERVLTTGEAARGRDQHLPRYGLEFIEECYFDYTLSPIWGDGGTVDGVIHAVMETTARVISERRLRTLRDLAAWRTAGASSVEDVCERVVRILAENPHDLPWALLYLLDTEGGRATLTGVTGLKPGSPASPAAVELDDPNVPWPFCQVSAEGKPVEVADLLARVGPLPGGSWPEPPRRAVVLPMARPGQSRLAGFVVAGVSPRLAFDDSYQGFLDLLAGHVAAAVADALAYEERRRPEASPKLDRGKPTVQSALHPTRDQLDDGQMDGRAPGPRPRILLADDHADRREFLRRLLANQYDVEAVASGRTAWQTARQTSPDLILTDGLPGFDGFDLLRELRGDERTRSLPVLLLSAHAEEDCVEGLRPAADDGSNGPFGARELLARVEALLQMDRIRQQAEHAARESEERFRSIFDQTIAGIAQTDLTGRFMQVNGHYCAIVGRSPEELYQLRMQDLTHPDDLPANVDLFRQMVEGSGEPFVIEKRYVRPDGSHVWVSNSVSLVRDRHGEPRYTVCVSLDVTDRRRAEEALRQREQHMRAIVETTPECVKLVASEGTLLEMNPAGLAMIEAPNWEAVAGKPVNRVIAPEYREAFQSMHERICRGEKGTLEFEIAGLSGGRRAVETHAVPLQMADGELVHLAITRDISERKRREHALRRLVECGRVTGPLFFEVLVQTLAEVLGVRYAFIGELPLESPRQARTLAVWANGKRAENFAYELSGTPCENVVQQRTCFYHSGVVSLFPADRLLADMGVDSYLGTPLRGSDGTTLGLLVVLHDKPLDERLQPEALLELSAGRVAAELERQRSEHALRESERKLRLIAENTTDTVFAYDMSRRLLYVNPAFEKLTGYATSQLYQGEPIDYLHPEDAPRMRNLIDGAFQGQSFDGMEFRIVTRGGQVKWCLSSWGPLRNADGVQVGVQGREHDVTERKRAEQERAELLAREQAARAEAEVAQRRYRELVDGLDAIVWEADARTWDFTFVSRRAEQLLGYPVQRWLNERGFWSNLIHPGDREQALELCSTACAECRDHDFEYRVVAADGRIVWLRDIVYVVRGTDGGATHLRGIMIDITRTKELEAALQQRAVELAEADRRKDEFLATLAHELRNPLAPICNSLQVLGMAGSNWGLVDQARGLMERQLTQMVRLIDDLLDVSRITRDKLELRKEWVELDVAVQCAVDTAHPLIEAAEHRLTVTLPHESVLLHADLIRLAQIFSNLLTNAAKYTERGGEISLTAERQGDDLVVRVRDTGVGIPADKLQYVFDLFVQVDRSLERSQGGLGIGLTLVKRLVELHGGSVDARSDGPGQGSVFTVRLPLSTGARERATTPLPDGGMLSRLTRCRILVVDDNKDSAESLALMLRLRGAEVRTAYDGLKAVEEAGPFQPNVILLDIGMPKLNGYDAARRIREQSWARGTVLIAMTGWGQEEDKRRAAEAGFDHHLTKPIEPTALEEALRGRVKLSG